MSSLYTLILREVQNELATIDGLQGIVTYRRKQPRLTERDQLPAIVICPGIEVEAELHSENTAQFVYPVYVSLWQAGNLTLEENLDRMLDWRELVRQHFHKPTPLAALAPVNKATRPWVIDGDVIFTTNFEPSLFEVSYDVSELQLQFLSEEDREST